MLIGVPEEDVLTKEKKEVEDGRRSHHDSGKSSWAG